VVYVEALTSIVLEVILPYARACLLHPVASASYIATLTASGANVSHLDALMAGNRALAVCVVVVLVLRPVRVHLPVAIDGVYVRIRGMLRRPVLAADLDTGVIKA
jgi:hypothetical protein